MMRQLMRQLLVLTLLGLAIGAWSIDLQDAEPAGGVPIGTGIWTGISMLISAFIGGYITARMSGSPLRSDGLYHGVIVWGVNWLVFAWLTTTVMATLLGGVFSAFGATLNSLGQGPRLWSRLPLLNYVMRSRPFHWTNCVAKPNQF